MRIATTAAVQPPAGRVGSDEQLIIDRMRADRTIEHVAALNAAPRVWKTPGYDAGVAYVLRQLEDSGWDVHVETLQASGWQGGTLKNVVAERRGTAPDDERGLVVAGAHLDSVRGAPGANDNASGSATLIELARSLDGIDTRNDIRLVWFDGEEAGLLGSRAHVKANAADSARTVAMLNMDMVGSPFGNVGGFSLGARTPSGIGDAIKAVMLRTGLEGELLDERHTRSDHASFDSAGIPTLDFGVGVKTIAKEDPYYHSPKDSLDKVNLDVLEGYGDLIGAMLLDAANRESRYAGAAPPKGITIEHGDPK